MSLADDARAWTAKGKENRWIKAQETVRRAWDSVLKAIKTRADQGYDSVYLETGTVSLMKKWNYEDRDALVVRLQNHGFRSKQIDKTVFAWWEKE
jgi:L-rhamnose mutarotase